MSDLVRKAAIELLESLMNDEERKAPVLDVNKSRQEYRTQYLTNKLSTFNGEKCQIRSNITSKGIPAYASLSPFHSLSRIGIKDLVIHVQAKGSYLLLRTLELPILVVGMMLFVEDHLGRVIIVTLYNFIQYDSEIPVEEVWPIGTVFMIKEPFLKLAVSGQIVIRCDCPTDIIIIDHNHPMFQSVSKMKWKNTIDRSAIHRSFPSTAFDWKEEGNSLYNSKRYSKSLQFYFSALKLSSDSDFTAVLQKNISAAYLALGCFEDALKYAKLVLEVQSNNIKALCIAGKSHYGLRQFDEALSMFDSVIHINSAHKNALMEKKHCIERIEEKKGNFDIYKLYLTSLLKPFTPINFGVYIGPIEIAHIEGKGRGIVASQNIKPGSFLLLSKAFQAVFDADVLNSVAALSINCDFTMSHGNRVKLLSQTCQAVMKNPNTFGGAIYNLSTNEPALDKKYQVFCDEPTKQEPIADAERISKILSVNCFSLLTTKDQERCFTMEKYSGSGLFIYASYFNHSCIPNATWHTYNDVIVIRSSKFIRKGNEVTISYTSSREDFLKKETKGAKRGFLCRCILCRLDRSEPAALHQKRAALEEQHESLCNEHYSNVIINPSNEVKQKMNKVIHAMEMTYAQRSILKIRLFSPYMRVAQGINLPIKDDKHYSDTIIEVVDKALSALGLSCELLLRCASDEDFSFPEHVLLCEYSLHQVLIFLISRFQVAENQVLALKWAKVLIKIHHLFTGGNVQMLKSQFKDSLPNLYVLLSSLQ